MFSRDEQMILKLAESLGTFGIESIIIIRTKWLPTMLEECEQVIGIKILQYLIQYGIATITKIQDHYRYNNNRNLCLSWSIVI